MALVISFTDLSLGQKKYIIRPLGSPNTQESGSDFRGERKKPGLGADRVTSAKGDESWIT